jgi:hypothetical protein
MSDTDAAQRTAPRRVWLPWVLLVLWLGWIVFLAWTSRPYWGAPRVGPKPLPAGKEAPHS